MPQSIKRFEILFLVSLLIGLINASLGFKDGAAYAGTMFVLFVQGATLLVMLALVLFVSRKRSRIAKWILVLGFLLGLIPSIPALGTLLAAGVQGLLAIATLALQCIGVYFLFEKSSSDYLAGLSVPSA